jgi:hypothetical protein
MELFRVISGIIIALIGVIIVLFGGIGWMVYEIWELIVSTESVGFFDLLWLGFVWFIRDLIAFIVGGVLFFIGKALME